MRVIIDEKGLNESNPEAGTSLNVRGNIIATGLTVNGPISGSSISISVPTNPTYYISSTGNDGASHTGTISDPLATPQEACRRLKQSGWSVEAFVITKDTINLGANPNLAVPEPVGGALPVCFQTTYVVDVAGVACTGGTAGTASSAIVIGGTFTSADASALNTQRGKILQVVAGATINGCRYIIHTNDGAGTFRIPMRVTNSPVAGNTFNIVSRAGKWTWSGVFLLTGNAKIIDGMEMLPTGVASFINEGVLQTSAMRWVTVTTFTIAGGRDSTWIGGVITGVSVMSPTPTSRQDWNPTGVTPCGDRIDGAGGLVNFLVTFGENSTTNFWGMSSFQGVDFSGLPALTNLYGLNLTDCTTNDCGWSASTQLNFRAIRIEAGRATPANTSIVAMFIGTAHSFVFVHFDTPSAANHLIEVSLNASFAPQGVSGVAGAAGKLFLNILTGARVRASAGAGNTATGGTAGTDVSVDGGVGFATALLSTHGVVEAGRMPWQSSVDTSATPATTANANKWLGIFALAAASGATFTWTNTLVQVGDTALVSLQTRDTTAVAPIVVCTANTITITFNAAATATTKFSVQLVKATS